VEAAEVVSGAVAMVVGVAVEEILEGEGIVLAEEIRLQDRALVTCLDQVLANLLLDLV